MNTVSPSESREMRSKDRPGLGFTAIKFRVYPNASQTQLFQKTSGCCRFVYNQALAYKKKVYKKTGESPSAYDLCKKLTQLKKEPKYAFLNEVQDSALRNSIRDLDRAFKNFFKKRARYPKFKAKGKCKESFSITNSTHGSDVKIHGSKVKIGKYGYVRARGGFGLYNNERILSVTVSLDSDGNWYASVLILKDTTVQDHVHKYESCGIDLGVKKPVVVAYESHDNSVKTVKTGRDFSRRLSEAEEKRRRYQRAYNRKRKGSKNQSKAARKVSRAFYREKCLRRDFIEKTTHQIATNCRVVVVEDLNVKGMTKSSKGTIENPGKNVAAKSGLNRELIRLGMGMFVTRLEQKVSKYQGTFIKVDPKHTSQTCNKCRHKSKANRRSQAEFECVRCGHTDNADYNAARNIRAIGLYSLAA